MEGMAEGERLMQPEAPTNRQHDSKNCGWAGLTERWVSLCRHRVGSLFSRVPVWVGIDWLVQRYKINFILKRNFSLI